MSLRTRAILSTFITIALIGLALLIWAYQKGKITIFGLSTGQSITLTRIPADGWNSQKDESSDNNFDLTNGIKLLSGNSASLKWEQKLSDTFPNIDRSGVHDIAYDTNNKKIYFYGKVAGDRVCGSGTDTSGNPIDIKKWLEETWVLNLTNYQWSQQPLGNDSKNCGFTLDFTSPQSQFPNRQYLDNVGNLIFNKTEDNFTLYARNSIWNYNPNANIWSKNNDSDAGGYLSYDRIMSRAFQGIDCTGSAPCSVPYSTQKTVGASVAKDTNENFVFFGGALLNCQVQCQFSGYSSGTWVYHKYSGSYQWNELTISGAKPPARKFAKMIYDDTINKFILFGGSDGTNFLNDVWLFTLKHDANGVSGTWEDITELVKTNSGGETKIPAPRDGLALAYTENGISVLYGGYNNSVLKDTWVLKSSAAAYKTKPMKSPGPLTKITLGEHALPTNSSIKITPYYAQSNSSTISKISDIPEAEWTALRETDVVGSVNNIDVTDGVGPDANNKYVYYYLKIEMKLGDDNQSPSINELSLDFKPTINDVINPTAKVKCDASNNPTAILLGWSKVSEADGYLEYAVDQVDPTIPTNENELPSDTLYNQVPQSDNPNYTINGSSLQIGNTYNYKIVAYKMVTDINGTNYFIYSRQPVSLSISYSGGSNCNVASSVTPGPTQSVTSTPSGPYVITIGNFNPVTGEQYAYNSTVTIKSNVGQSGTIDSFGFYDPNNNLLENNPAFRFTYDSPTGKSIAANGTLSFNLKIARVDGLEGAHPIIFKATISGTEYVSPTKNLVVTKVTPTPTPSPSPSATSTTSGQASSTPGQSSTPSPIGDFSAVVVADTNAFAPSCSQIKLTWSAPGDNRVRGYNIYSAKNDTYLASTSDTQYSFSALQGNATYSFYIRAHDGTSAGLSAKSSIASVTTPSCNIQQIYSPATTTTTGTTTTGTAGTAGSVGKLISTGGALWFNILIALLFGGVVSWLMLRKK